MKRHIQKTGVRKFFGQDFIDLQAEPLRALDTFFAEYGACVIQGCELSVNGDGTYDVAAGLVAIEAADSETGDSSIKVMPFDGATGVALPLYLTAVGVVDERVYGDGRVKPIAVDFRAVASGVKPLGAHIVLSEAVSNRFVDVLQDDTHTFVSTAERARWNDILRLAKEYAKGYVDARETAVRADMAIGDTAASRSAIEYTDARERIVRGDMAAADVATLRDAKSYADQIVAALVDGSPELLNTLEELAGALGNDPNFATTVMTEIGKRVKTSDFDTHTHQSVPRLGWYDTDGSGVLSNCWLAARRANPLDGSTRLFLREGETIWHNLVWVHGADTVHWNGVTNKEQATASAPGLMSAEDKERFDAMAAVSNDEKASWNARLPYGTRSETNLNTLTIPGSYFVTNAVNGPVAGNSELGLYVSGGNENPRVFQLAVSNSDSVYFRWRHDWVSWSPWREFYHSGNLKIIRGAVTAAGYSGGGNASEVGNVYGEPAVVRVTHNLGTTAYSAQATAVSNAVEGYSDNTVTVWRKAANYTDFVVTEGPGTARELCAFDYLIIPY